MTKDLALLVGADTPFLTTEEFLAALDENLRAAIAGPDPAPAGPKENTAHGPQGKVTVVGAGFYGSTTAQRLAEYDIFDEVVLTDIVEGKPEGLALDMNQSRPIEGFETKVTGQTTGPERRGLRGHRRLGRS